MPPKGWRKDSQGNYPQQSFIKEQEKLTVDDLLFPKSTILNLAKEVQRENDPNKKLIIGKDASLALQRSATVFVNHLLMFAREWAKDQDRKSCNVDDILVALEHIGHPGLKPLVQARVNEYQRVIALRKQAKLQEKEKENPQEQTEEANYETEEETNEPNKKQKLDTTESPPESTIPSATTTQDYSNTTVAEDVVMHESEEPTTAQSEQTQQQ
ncbi:DNA polymerase epsilon noncatalytic subunit [Monosporozyma unispora]|nr:DNA polymerase epsilon noncatalytic subunit [Kazachstania unispora]